ncbi:MAG: phenylacetate-CoA oxygenase subunit PaaC [Burkholderiaceae bacterium]|nr:phenylacetate-CoA oxygenase subunit PaaC [Burkholderiaceae bacterium]
MSDRITAIAYLLHLADNALVLGQRNAEWCGHGPVLEEDIAMANIGLDLIGQARLLYQHAAGLLGGENTEDKLAYFREPGEFRNYTLLELPNHGPLAGSASADRDYATTITRSFLYSSFMLLRWEALQQSSDTQLAAIAAKSLKEVRYHVRHSSDWMLRLGDGTPLSRARMQAALDHLMPYTQEFWTPSAFELAAQKSGLGANGEDIHGDWDEAVDTILAEATLTRPATEGHVPQGKNRIHSEHLSWLLSEMQGLARAHPEATW